MSEATSEHEKEKSFWCPGCDSENSEKDGFSLDGYHIAICQKCWEGLRPFERILLSMLATTGFDGADGLGLGVGFELSNIHDLIRERFGK